MKTHPICIVFLCSLALRASGQDVSGARKELQDAAQKLEQARQTNLQLPDGVTEAAKAALQSPELKKQAVDTAKSLLPEARKLMKSGSTKDGASKPAAQAGAAPAPSGPEPRPLPALEHTSAKPRVPTVVIESDSSVFDLNEAVFIYTGRVRARHPQFYIECDELVVHMEKQDSDGEKQDEVGSKPGKASEIVEAGKDKPRDGGIKKAIATGSTVTIEKLNELGETQIGKCRKAVYEGASGQIVMSDYPQVQRGNILHIATQPDTLMIFDPGGRLRTTGRPRTVILSEGEQEAREGSSVER